MSVKERGIAIPGMSLNSSSCPPASNKSTFHSSISVNLLAKSVPAEPAPTITKSNVPKSTEKTENVLQIIRDLGLSD